MPSYRRMDIRNAHYPYTVYFYGKILPVPQSGVALVHHQGEVRPMYMEAFPTYLGTTAGHSRIYINCDHCGYVGVANTEKRRGCAYYVFGLTTLGIGLVFDIAKDTHHFCPTCERHVGYAKFL